MNAMYSYSVVIPTFNRKRSIDAAINSAMPLVNGGEAEIIVVDDASTDGTSEHIAKTYCGLIAAGHLQLIRVRENMGATAAKNAGAAAARGTWIIFLDSDDVLVSGIREILDVNCSACDKYGVSLVFFRCRNRSGQVMGEATLNQRLIGCRELLCNWIWGECLPVVRTTVANQFPYDADLRGFEGLAYARMARTYGSALIANAIARIYDDAGVDRLSTRSKIMERSCLMARGFHRMLVEFQKELTAAKKLFVFSKYMYYITMCLFVTVARPWTRACMANTEKPTR